MEGKGCGFPDDDDGAPTTTFPHQTRRQSGVCFIIQTKKCVKNGELFIEPFPYFKLNRN